MAKKRKALSKKLNKKQERAQQRKQQEKKKEALLRKKQQKQQELEEEEVGENVVMRKRGGGDAAKYMIDRSSGALTSVKGLRNLGNTCFFNSTLQSLLQTRPLVEHFLDMHSVFPESQYYGEDMYSTARNPPGVFALALGVTLKQYYAEPSSSPSEAGKIPGSRHMAGNVIVPSVLLQNIIKKAPQFRGYRQQDAQELLRYLCSITKDEYLEKKSREDKKRKKQLEEERDKEEGAEERAKEEKKEIDSVDQVDLHNVIDRTFKTGLFSTILCHNCGNVSRTRDMMHDVSAPIPVVNTSTKNKAGKHEPTEADMQLGERFKRLKMKELEAFQKNKENMLNPDEIMEHLSEYSELEREVSVMSCLWGFFKSEILSGDNGYLCEKCSTVRMTPASPTESDGDSATDDGSKNDSEDTGKSGNNKSNGKKETEDDDQSNGIEEENKVDEVRKKKKATKTTKILRDASKQFSIEVPPEVLVVHLKRFTRSGKMPYTMLSLGGFVKNNTPVKINKTIDLTPFIHSTSPYKSKENLYDLYAIVEHSGGMGGGHYVAYICPLQSYADGTWRHSDQYYHISDSSVGRVNESDVLNRVQPYMLFFQRRRHEHPSPRDSEPTSSKL